MSRRPAHLNGAARQMNAQDDPCFGRQWYPWSIVHKDPGLENSVDAALRVLVRHGLILDQGEYLVPPRMACSNQYAISSYGDYVIERLQGS